MEREYGKVILCNKLVLTLVLLALLTAAEAVVGLVHEAAAAMALLRLVVGRLAPQEVHDDVRGLMGWVSVLSELLSSLCQVQRSYMDGIRGSVTFIILRDGESFTSVTSDKLKWKLRNPLLCVRAIFFLLFDYHLSREAFYWL